MKIKDIAKYGIIACVLVSASASAQSTTLARHQDTPPDNAKPIQQAKIKPEIRLSSDFIHEMIDPCEANPQLKRCKVLNSQTKKNN